MHDNFTWNIMIAIIFLMIPIYGYVYLRFFRKRKNEWMDFAFLLFIGLLVRLCLAYYYKGFILDMNLFKAWGKQIVDQGVSSIYSSDMFIDYPPGYLCVLGVLERIVRSMGTTSEAAINLVYKIPACLCDLAAGYYIYRIAKKKLPESISLLLTAAYLFNPTVLLDSAIWGQVDSVYTLIVIIILYNITQKRLPIAYFATVIGVLIKPQTMFFGPILIWAIIEQVFLENFNWQKFWLNLWTGLLSLACGFFFMYPFGIAETIGQYTDTLSSYPYASVNAANFWGMLGMNWSGQEETLLGIPAQVWGSLFLIATIGFVILICYQMRKEESKYFFAGACLIVMIFTLSVRMHERYMFPALALLLIAYCLKPIKQLLFAFVGLSITQFLNIGFALQILPDYEGYTGSKMPEMVVISILTVLMCLYCIYIGVRWYLRGKEKNEEMLKEQVERDERFDQEKKKYYDGITSSKILGKMTRLDVCILFAIVCLYSAVALYNVGASEDEVPNTEYFSEWYSTNGQTVYPTITLDLGEQPELNKLAYYLGNYEDRNFKVETASTLDGTWTNRGEFTMKSVFRWAEYSISSNERYIRLTSTNNAISIFELVVLNANGDMVTPLNAEEYPELFDENEKYDVCTARNSSYFDEVYHPRTAYEFIKGRYSYEWTHPPLGKCFIALGMLIFGVCPFGWRIMGVLFGIAMLPFIYLFIKRMLKETWIAACVTILFAFDFMHFVQTRIGTIDVFVTFFIIGMYYFMYKYVSMSFYDTPLKKTWIPLGLSGLFMGFGVASKWTGAYAGVGLAVLFFASLFRRYKEYLYAKKCGEGNTNGVDHQYVMDHFVSHTIKTLWICVLFFVVIPVIIYTLSYLPFSDGSDDGLIMQMLKNQEAMFNYHSNLESTHPYSCTWYNWPIMYRPVWYYSRQISETVSEGISAFGNPSIWWVGIPAAIYMVYLIWRDRDKKAIFLFVSYMAQYLPWCLITRTTYMYHYFPSVPFVTMMIGYAIFKLVNGSPKRKRIAYFYVALTVGLFFFFYPVLSGYPVEKQWVYDNLKWFDTWVLVS